MLTSAALPLLLLALSCFVAASPAPLSHEGAELRFMETLEAIEQWGAEDVRSADDERGEGSAPREERMECGELQGPLSVAGGIELMI